MHMSDVRSFAVVKSSPVTNLPDPRTHSPCQIRKSYRTERQAISIILAAKEELCVCNWQRLLAERLLTHRSPG